MLAIYNIKKKKHPQGLTIFMAAINHTVGDQQLEFGINGFPFNLKNPGLFFFLRQLEFPEKKPPQIEYEHIHKEN